MRDGRLGKRAKGGRRHGFGAGRLWEIQGRTTARGPRALQYREPRQPTPAPPILRRQGFLLREAATADKSSYGGQVGATRPPSPRLWGPEVGRRIPHTHVVHYAQYN